MTAVFDKDRSKQFMGRVMQMLNSSATLQMISLGNRVGLFDAMDEMEPATSTQIAEAARLDERYVREWLGGMVGRDGGRRNRRV